MFLSNAFEYPASLILDWSLELQWACSPISSAAGNSDYTRNGFLKRSGPLLEETICKHLTGNWSRILNKDMKSFYHCHYHC